MKHDVWPTVARGRFKNKLGLHAHNGLSVDREVILNSAHASMIEIIGDL